MILALKTIAVVVVSPTGKVMFVAVNNATIYNAKDNN